MRVQHICVHAQTCAHLVGAEHLQTDRKQKIGLLLKKKINFSGNVEEDIVLFAAVVCLLKLSCVAAFRRKAVFVSLSVGIYIRRYTSE